MSWKSMCFAVIVLNGVAAGAVRAEDAPKAKPTTAPTTKPATTKPAAKPRKPTDAVGEVNRNPRRHEAFLAEIKKGDPHDLLFIGDSITDFWPSRGKDSWAKFADYKPLDLGISGECTEDVLFRLNHGELDGYTPKAVVIMIGTNNLGHYGDEKPEWVAPGVEKIVKTVRNKFPDTHILLLGIFPRGLANSAAREHVEATNALLAKATFDDKTKYLDIGKKFLDDKGELPPAIMPDKLHPSDKGYTIWYDAMWPTLSEMLK